MGVAFGMSLLFCTEAEILRCFTCTSGNYGDCKEDIRRRLASGKAAVAGLNKIWDGNEVRMKTKVRLMEALVSSATHGAETWTTRKADIKKIEAFKNWYWRKMLRISRIGIRTNASIQQQL